MAIQTATPDQVASCVLALKQHIDRVEVENRAKDAEIKRLREALEKIRTLLFRLQWADIGTGEAIEEITNIVKETDHE